MKRWSFSVLLSIGLVLVSGNAFSQGPSNSGGFGGQPWPLHPPVGIGTQLSIGGPQSALHINFNHADGHSDTAMLRLSNGDTTTSNLFGLLGLMPGPYDTAYSSLSRGNDLILHEHSQGDLILTNYQSSSLTHPYGAIRLATTPKASELPLIPPSQHDYERMTILGNGNVGIDLPPDTSMTRLGNPKDQLQLGGGPTIPGLTFYGGNQFEGLLESDGHTLYPTDYRGIAFNHYEDHVSGIGSRFTPTDWSSISFYNGSGGFIGLSCNPWHTGDALTSTYGGVTLSLTGTNGLEFWSDDSLLDRDHYHHLFDCWRKGFTGGLGIRNDSGLFFHHTPVYIGGTGYPNFTNLFGVHPAIGDGDTWMLAVNGAVLGKEFYVSLDWPDFVFDPEYKLTPLPEVEKYIKANHHLQDIPSAVEMGKTGVPLGKTDAALTKKVEELTLYTIELNKKIESLESKLEGLEKQGGK